MNIKKIIFSILIFSFLTGCGTLSLQRIDNNDQQNPETTEDPSLIREPLKPYEEDTFKVKGLDSDRDNNNDDNDIIEEEDL